MYHLTILGQLLAFMMLCEVLLIGIIAYVNKRKT